ncbi:MAG TPA: hypothetical protein VN366_09480 [Feifaniaceae bacterium]|nr:hypothetical protein [Feifaniaceae bacterium]
MDELSKLYGALGLSRRAGKCLTGDFAVEKALKSGKTKLVVLDSGASEATRERYRDMCGRSGAALIELPGAGHAVGKPAGKIIAITDDRFVHMILCAHAQFQEKRDSF